jgi:hypothetical protein
MVPSPKNNGLAAESDHIKPEGDVESQALMDIMMDRKANHLFESGKYG